MGDAPVLLDAGIRAALQGRKSVTYVCPPSAWAVIPLFAELPEAAPGGIRLLVLAPETGDVFDVARSLRPLARFQPILSATGLARAGRLLAASAVRTLVATPRDAVTLLEMSRLKPGGIPVIALLWPEFMLAAGETALIDSLLAEASEAQRVIVTSDPAAVKDLLERHARRAAHAIGSQPPEHAAAAARYVVVEGERHPAAVRAVLDTLNPSSTFLWEPAAADRYERWTEFAEDPSVTIGSTPPAERQFDAAIAVELPSAEFLAQLAGCAGQVIVLVRASQVPYLLRLAKPLKNLHLAGAADRARERAHALRQSVRQRLEDHDVLNDLLALGPLFDEYDPALVAAALARGAGGAPAVESAAPLPAWVRIQVTVGKRDHVRPSDLVGALLNGVGLPKDHVGRVDIREGFSIVEVSAQDAARALRGLAGLTVRGKALGARVAK
ncbi:MAG: DbpA RNA binding domain-containing protein [Gemmatimonadetes bacterium]|nr:DbpA RNA binding domain-containing protein [Gemmatimonadota bacterium]